VHRPAGLTILPAYVATSRAALGSLQRDFAQLRALDHPNIARLLELGCTGQQYYARTERLDGESLREVLAHLFPERLELEEADDIVRAIGCALVHAHGRDVVHGDVCCENVFVTMDRRIVLTNFLAQRVGRYPGWARRPSDDVVGLATLASKLYTGSSLPHAVHGARHTGVPAARLNAIRAVLETRCDRRPSVAEFLAAAGLSLTDDAVATARRSPRQEQPRSSWRYVLPVAGSIAIGSLVASYQVVGGKWFTLTNSQQREVDLPRTVGTPVLAPPAKAPATPADVRPSRAVSTAGLNSAAARPAAPPAADSQRRAIATVDEREDGRRRASLPTTSAAAATTATQRRDPTVVSMRIPRIAVREGQPVVVINIVRSGDITSETSVDWWVTPETAEPDQDYATGGKQVLSFPAGSTEQRLLIPIIDDDVREPDEVFTVHLGMLRNGVRGGITATRVNVYDDD